MISGNNFKNFCRIKINKIFCLCGKIYIFEELGIIFFFIRINIGVNKFSFLVLWGLKCFGYDCYCG